jgi:hypothetical protein
VLCDWPYEFDHIRSQNLNPRAPYKNPSLSHIPTPFADTTLTISFSPPNPPFTVHSPCDHLFLPQSPPTPHLSHRSPHPPPFDTLSLSSSHTTLSPSPDPSSDATPRPHSDCLPLDHRNRRAFIPALLFLGLPLNWPPLASLLVVALARSQPHSMLGRVFLYCILLPAYLGVLVHLSSLSGLMRHLLCRGWALCLWFVGRFVSSWFICPQLLV